MTSHDFPHRSIAAGIPSQAFDHLTDADRHTLITLMARIAEQAFRRGAYHGAKLASDDAYLLPKDLYAWRYGRSLDLSPWLDDATVQPSTERLFTECIELEALGFTRSDSSDDSDRMLNALDDEREVTVTMSSSKKRRVLKPA